MKHLVAVALVVASATMSRPRSPAQQTESRRDAEPKENESRFQRLDVDANGELSRDELFMIAPALFDQLDQDEDSVLSPEELGALPDARNPRASFRQLDTDGDGRIHRDELPEEMRALFERFDANADGFVDENEVKRMALSAREARNGPNALMRRVMELDVDGDGRLHRDELPEAMAYLRREFDEVDVNGDDYIDGAELRAFTEESQRLRWRYER
jgi:Ca2+-binding EF-hand superfamily protein